MKFIDLIIKKPIQELTGKQILYRYLLRIGIVLILISIPLILTLVKYGTLM